MHTTRGTTKSSTAKGGTAKVSSRLDPTKISDPFGSSKTKFRTQFSREHSAGAIPVHIHHTGNVMSLAWDCPYEEVPEARLLVLSAAGLQEQAHPYVFLAPAMFDCLMQREGVGERAVLPNLDAIVPHLRGAMLSGDSFTRGLHSFGLVSDAVGPALNKFLTVLLQNIAKHLNTKAHREQIELTLNKLEHNGGPDASRIIKTKVPTYNTIHRISSAKPAPKRAAFT